MNTNIDNILYELFEQEPVLNEEVKAAVVEKLNTSGNRFNMMRKVLVVATCILTFLALGVSAYALYKYLTPAEVAREMKNYDLEKAFESDKAVLIDESALDNGKRVTLLGYLPSSELLLLEEFSESVDENYQSYVVVAIENIDGTSMASEHGKFFVTPIIEGLNPINFNTATMNGFYSQVYYEGIDYRIIGMDVLEIFANRHMKLAVTSTTFYDVSAFDYDENNGTIEENKDYPGVNVLFEFPMDKSLGDEDAVISYVESLYPDYYEQMNESDISEVDSYEEQNVANFNDEKIDLTEVLPNDNKKYLIQGDFVQFDADDHKMILSDSYGNKLIEKIVPDNEGFSSGAGGVMGRDGGYLDALWSVYENEPLNVLSNGSKVFNDDALISLELRFYDYNLDVIENIKIQDYIDGILEDYGAHEEDFLDIQVSVCARYILFSYKNQLYVYDRDIDKMRLVNVDLSLYETNNENQRIVFGFNIEDNIRMTQIDFETGGYEILAKFDIDTLELIIEEDGE